MNYLVFGMHSFKLKEISVYFDYFTLSYCYDNIFKSYIKSKQQLIILSIGANAIYNKNVCDFTFFTTIASLYGNLNIEIQKQAYS